MHIDLVERIKVPHLRSPQSLTLCRTIIIPIAFSPVFLLLFLEKRPTFCGRTPTKLKRGANGRSVPTRASQFLPEIHADLIYKV
jgi:hypothetical protein